MKHIYIHIPCKVITICANEIDFTIKELEHFLAWADRSCLCESYYSYHCRKCVDRSEGFLEKHDKILQFCLVNNIVVRDSYHTLRLVTQ